jgi:hypothetical protein
MHLFTYTKFILIISVKRILFVAILIAFASADSRLCDERTVMLYMESVLKVRLMFFMKKVTG